MDLYIDPELQAVIQPPTDQERAQLEANLLAEGCRDPLVVWAGEPPARVCPSCPPGTPYSRATALIEAREGTVVWMCGFCEHGEPRPWIILDGHTRYTICQAHDIPFSIAEAPSWVRTFEEAKVWMIRNQLARRNLEPYQRAELALKLEPLIAAKAKEHQQQAGGAVPQKVAEAVDTRETLAQVASVSHETMRKAKVIAQEADEPIKQALRRGKRTIHGVYRELRPPRPAPTQADRADQKTDRPRLPSGRMKTAHEAQYDTQEGTSTTEPDTTRQRADQTPSSRIIKVWGQTSLRSQVKLRQQVVSRLAASPAIREAQIGRQSGAEVLEDRLSRLSWPDFVLLAAYVLGQAEAAPAAWVEAATAAWAEADEYCKATATLATADVPRLDTMSTEKDSLPAAVAAADDPVPNLEDVAL
jgi:hypothetical protein